MDQLGYLPEDGLAKVDRASMASSLETRLPLLDHRLVELSWQLPLDLRIQNGVTKQVLRSILYKHVPRELVERKKMGFTVPLDAWLKGELRAWADDTLRSQDFLQDLPFNDGAVENTWRRYQEGNGVSAYQMWALVVLAAWRQDAHF
jgi:asparagine synthase (glutamine-hydrolysing)